MTVQETANNTVSETIDGVVSEDRKFDKQDFKEFEGLLDLKFALDSYAHTKHGKERETIETSVKGISALLNENKNYDLYMSKIALPDHAYSE